MFTQCLTMEADPFGRSNLLVVVKEKRPHEKDQGVFIPQGNGNKSIFLSKSLYGLMETLCPIQGVLYSSAGAGLG